MWKIPKSFCARCWTLLCNNCRYQQLWEIILRFVIWRSHTSPNTQWFNINFLLPTRKILAFKNTSFLDERFRKSVSLYAVTWRQILLIFNWRQKVLSWLFLRVPRYFSKQIAMKIQAQCALYEISQDWSFLWYKSLFSWKFSIYPYFNFWLFLFH